MAQLDGSNNLQTRYLTELGTNQLLTRTVASGTNAGVSIYETDNQGSVRDIVSWSGAVRDHIDYSGYGVITTESNSSVGDQHKYGVYQYFAALGLYDAKARWYNPATGNWQSLDPILFGGGQPNLYQYVGNDPTNATDPTGCIGWSKFIPGSWWDFATVVGGSCAAGRAEQPRTAQLDKKIAALQRRIAVQKALAPERAKIDAERAVDPKPPVDWKNATVTNIKEKYQTQNGHIVNAKTIAELLSRPGELLKVLLKLLAITAMDTHLELQTRSYCIISPETVNTILKESYKSIPIRCAKPGDILVWPDAAHSCVLEKVAYLDGTDDGTLDTLATKVNSKNGTLPMGTDVTLSSVVKAYKGNFKCFIRKK